MGLTLENLKMNEEMGTSLSRMIDASEYGTQEKID